MAFCVVGFSLGGVFFSFFFFVGFWGGWCFVVGFFLLLGFSWFFKLR